MAFSCLSRHEFTFRLRAKRKATRDQEEAKVIFDGEKL
jgi:hypothetical protein